MVRLITPPGDKPTAPHPPAGPPPRASNIGRLNAYRCPRCNRVIITQDVDEGVTPFQILCKITNTTPPHFMQSMFYPPDIPADQYPGWEWYKPSPEEVEAMHPENPNLRAMTREHVAHGGLLMRVHKVVVQSQLRTAAASIAQAHKDRAIKVWASRAARRAPPAPSSPPSSPST